MASSGAPIQLTNPLVRCSAPIFDQYLNPIEEQTCQTLVLKSLSTPCSGSPGADSDPHAPRYTCPACIHIIDRFLRKRRFHFLTHGCFVKVCDDCALSLQEASPPARRLSLRSSPDETAPKYRYQRCECTISLRAAIDFRHTGSCFECMSNEFKNMQSAQDIARQRLQDHPTFCDGHEPGLPHTQGTVWVCACGKKYKTSTEGRTLAGAMQCLGCAQFRCRDLLVSSPVAARSSLLTPPPSTASSPSLKSLNVAVPSFTALGSIWNKDDQREIQNHIAQASSTNNIQSVKRKRAVLRRGEEPFQASTWEDHEESNADFRRWVKRRKTMNGVDFDGFRRMDWKSHSKNRPEEPVGPMDEAW